MLLGASASVACVACVGWQCAELKSYLLPSHRWHMQALDLIVDEEQFSNLRFFQGYISSMDTQRRLPRAVLECLTADRFLNDEKNTDRSKCRFVEKHRSIPAGLEGALDNYRGSGFSRGHLSASGNHTSSQIGQCESFVISANIVPQNGQNNAGYWLRLEELSRAISKSLQPSEQLWVISGPLFFAEKTQVDPTPELSRFRKAGVKYYNNLEVLGNSVSVPSHLFKALILLNSDKIEFAAFVIPNTHISANRKLEEFKVSRDDLRRMTGFDLVPNATKAIEYLAAVDEHWMDPEQFEAYMAKRRLKWAQTDLKPEAKKIND